MRRSLLVPSRFRDQLWDPEGIYLTNLQDWYTVEVFADTTRGKLHIKGSKKNVLESYAAVRNLLVEW